MNPSYTQQSYFGAQGNQGIQGQGGGNPTHGSGRGNSISLNVHLTVPGQQPAGAAAAAAAGTVTTTADGSHTPNTPEILNSIVNMQHPFAGYAQSGASATGTPSLATTSSSYTTLGTNLQTNEQLNERSRSVTPMRPGASSGEGEPTAGPSSQLSVQHYRSQFIKEGLKMKVKQKLGAIRDRHVSEESAASPASTVGTVSTLTSPVEPSTSFLASPGSDDSCGFPPDVKIKTEELTEEDEVRRYKRRERNKVAATKCRNKKKLRTQLLIKESETLETQNIHLKSEIEKLESEKKRLMEVLSYHEPTCAKKMRLSEPETPGAAESSDITTTVMDGEGNVNVRISVPSQGTMERLSNQTTANHSSSNWKPDSYEQASVPYPSSASSCGDHFSSMGGSFLAKRPPPHAYLDLDSRCSIAL